MSDQHVVPDGNGGWNVKGAGNSRVTKNFEKKSDAEKFAREISQNQHSELVIHNRDGKISRKDSHGHDSFPPKG
ncbi:hypothetical protein [Lactobacillus plantarum] [Lactiplantibacillus mudanjiangensis]|uniref:DUF2188 domain-containing protein n=1 Tax=Lactiplantibacillus mudanjiangensis TaxID=1296538 RepID=UPI0010157EA3|nr:hypothetical protein [Lactobacillus plantarum] [Lactiplantibacillus mudanjiangensis]